MLHRPPLLSVNAIDHAMTLTDRLQCYLFLSTASNRFYSLPLPHSPSNVPQDLLYYANQIPTLSTQLTILASVKAASSLASDHSHASDAVIVKNVQNLTQAVARTLRAAEGACMQVRLKDVLLFISLQGSLVFDVKNVIGMDFSFLVKQNQSYPFAAGTSPIRLPNHCRITGSRAWL